MTRTLVKVGLLTLAALAMGALWWFEASQATVQPASGAQHSAVLEQREDLSPTEELQREVVREPEGHGVARELLRQRLIDTFRLARRLAKLREAGVAVPESPAEAEVLLDELLRQRGDPPELLQRLATAGPLSAQQGKDFLRWALAHDKFLRLAPGVGEVLLRVEASGREELVGRFVRAIGEKIERSDAEAAAGVEFVFQRIADLKGTAFEPARVMSLGSGQDTRPTVWTDETRKVAVLRGYLLKRLFASRDTSEIELLLAYSKARLEQQDKLVLRDIAARLRELPNDEYTVGLAPVLRDVIAQSAHRALMPYLLEVVGLCHAIPWQEAAALYDAARIGSEPSAEAISLPRPAWMSGIASRTEAVAVVHDYLIRDYAGDRERSEYQTRRFFPSIVATHAKHLDGAALRDLMVRALDLGTSEVRNVIGALSPEALLGNDNAETALTVARALDASAAEGPDALLANQSLVRRLSPVVEDPMAFLDRFPRSDYRVRSTIQRCRIVELPRAATLVQVVQEARRAIEAKAPLVRALLESVRTAAAKAAQAGDTHALAVALADATLPWAVVEALLEGAILAGAVALPAVPVDHLVKRANGGPAESRWTVWSWLALVVVLDLPAEQLLTAAWDAWQASPPEGDETLLLRGIDDMRQLVALPR